MSRQNVLIIIIVILVVALGIVLWTNNPKKTNAPEVSNETQNINSENPEPEPNTNTQEQLPVNKNEEFEKSLKETTTNWVLTRVTVNQKEVDMNVNVAAPLTLQFDTEKNTYKGFAGCNNFSGTYSSEDDYVFDFGATVSTKMACPAIQLENSIFTVMNKTVSYGIKGGTDLIFESEDGYTQLLYNPAK